MNATPLRPRRKHFEAARTAVDNFEEEKRRLNNATGDVKGA
jgi:hypothetical protein